jgi:DNA-binding Lrp family transcriptional regulator
LSIRAPLQSPRVPEAAGARSWSLLSNHGHVLLCLARDPTIRVRDMAHTIGITERACYRIVGDLVRAGLIGRERVGRNNRYTINAGTRSPEPRWADVSVESLVAATMRSRQES